MNSSPQAGTVVLVHGAWADGSCWSNVILPLRHQGMNVTSAPIPLTSLTDDAAALRRVIEADDWPGHLGRARVCGCCDCCSR
jgi:pimeloyl-ACP methyl ester carboxylesterase